RLRLLRDCATANHHNHSGKQGNSMSHIRARQLSRAVHLALLGVFCTAPALAQSNEVVLDRIDVTGSRIKKAEIEGQTPVLTISREDIARSGLTSVGDIIQQLTGSGSSLNTRFN